VIICVRCDRAIRPGEPYDTHIHHGADVAGCTNYSHRKCPGLPSTGTEASPAADAARGKGDMRT
jgi:hypothetical protein